MRPGDPPDFQTRDFLATNSAGNFVILLLVILDRPICLKELMSECGLPIAPNLEVTGQRWPLKNIASTFHMHSV